MSTVGRHPLSIFSEALECASPAEQAAISSKLADALKAYVQGIIDAV